MDLSAEKLNVLQQIINTQDEGLIRDIKSLIISRELDWFDELSANQQDDVLEGLNQLDRNEVFSHDDAKKRFNIE